MINGSAINGASINGSAAAGFDYSGCAIILTPYEQGSGALLWNGRAILTAAHVLDGVTSAGYATVDITFNSNAVIPAPVVQSIVRHPQYDPVLKNFDLAIILLSEEVDASISRYDIYSLTDEITKTFHRVGYSPNRDVSTGALTGGSSWHKFNNLYECFLYDLPAGVYGTLVPDNYQNQLVYDFDDGTSTRDALGTLISSVDYGIVDEGGLRPGDSGSPAFINGKIAGVASLIKSVSNDINYPSSDGTYGEINVDMRVSSFYAWISNAALVSSINLLSGGSFNTTLDSTFAWVISGGSFRHDQPGIEFTSDDVFGSAPVGYFHKDWTVSGGSFKTTLYSTFAAQISGGSFSSKLSASITPEHYIRLNKHHKPNGQFKTSLSAYISHEQEMDVQGGSFKTDLSSFLGINLVTKGSFNTKLSCTLSDISSINVSGGQFNTVLDSTVTGHNLFYISGGSFKTELLYMNISGGSFKTNLKAKIYAE